MHVPAPASESMTVYELVLGSQSAHAAAVGFQSSPLFGSMFRRDGTKKATLSTF